MLLLLPEEGVAPEDLLTDEEALTYLTDSVSWDRSKRLQVNLSLPKFDVASRMDLIPMLADLGVTDVLDDETTDFSPLTADDADLALTQAAHAARVKIDEKGVEAAAYTILTVGETAAAEKPEEMDFVLDRPFLFAIVSPDGLPLFTGVVNDTPRRKDHRQEPPAEKRAAFCRIAGDHRGPGCGILGPNRQKKEDVIMYGAILGDIIGSPYEFDRGDKTKDFPLFSRESAFTDDSVMTVAVAQGLLDAGTDAPLEAIGAAVTASMVRWGRKYPYAGYGARFRYWLRAKEPQPYNSCGNGSAMRVSAAGWRYDTLERSLAVSAATAAGSHNHPEGIKGAQATAAAIFLARTGSDKQAIRDYIEQTFGYDLGRTCDEIRPGYHHVETCQETVPQAVTAFLEGESFEDVIRTAVSLGGDCDTLTAIAGSMAEAFYGLPEPLRLACRERVDPEMLQVLDRFDAVRKERP
jgi:ADP-ribosylglycohydrolase